MSAFDFRLAIILLIALCLSPSQTGHGFPNGVGDIADNGCLCHGSSNSDTVVEIIGLPDKFESNTTYALQLSITNSDIEQDDESPNGGFRILVSNGLLQFNESDVGQIIDNGWTHLSSGNEQRIWNMTWQSPTDNKSLTKITVHGNAVDGNGQSSGDEWNSEVYQIPGVENFDVIQNESKGDSELNMFNKILLLLGLMSLLYILLKVIVD